MFFCFKCVIIVIFILIFLFLGVGCGDLVVECEDFKIVFCFGCFGTIVDVCNIVVDLVIDCNDVVVMSLDYDSCMFDFEVDGNCIFSELLDFCNGVIL